MDERIIPAYFCNFDPAAIACEFSPALASELSKLYIMVGLRYTVRTVLHYPRTWPAAMSCIRRGIKAGMESEFVYMADYEPYLHLPVADVREALGVRGVTDARTTEISLRMGRRPRSSTLVAAGAKHAAQAAE